MKAQGNVQPGPSAFVEIALVTGGATRLGAHSSRRLAQAGYGVVVHHHDSTPEVVDEIRAAGGNAWALAADLCDAKQAASLVAMAEQLAGAEVTVVVNNAASYPKADFAGASWDDLSAVVALNVWAPWAIMRCIRRGVVVNILDARLADVDATHVPYLVGKAALAHLTAVAARVMAPFVRINAVSPGRIEFPDDKSSLQEKMLLHRLPTADEVAEAVYFLVSSPSITGETIHVDGGRHLGATK